MAPEFRPYQARLLFRGEPRLDGAWYPVDLDWQVGGDLDTSYGRLESLFERLTKQDRASRSDLDFYSLEVRSVPEDGQVVRWVPTRGREQRRGWL